MVKDMTHFCQECIGKVHHFDIVKIPSKNSDFNEYGTHLFFQKILNLHFFWYVVVSVPKLYVIQYMNNQIRFANCIWF